MAAAFNRQQQGFPAEPPSFSAGGHEMRDYYTDSLAPRPAPLDSSYLTPYLGLRARLSQTWINRWTVLILLVLIRLMFAIGTTNELIENARSDALSACMEVEKVASSVVSLPHYMAQGVNTLTASGINDAVGGLHSMANSTLTGVEEMVEYYISFLTSTYLCLITFAIGSAVNVATGALEDAATSINSTLKTIASDISSAASTIETDLQKFTSGINTALGENIPTIDFSSEITALNSVSIPSSIVQNLQKLNSSVPSFAQVKNDTNTLLSLPFQDARNLMNQAWGNYSFNTSLLPVPELDTVTFCSGNSDLNNFFDELRSVARKVRDIFLGVLIVLAILACIPAALLEIRRFAMLQIRQRIIKSFAFDPIDGIYLASRPFSSDMGRWSAGRFSNSKTQVLVRWFWAYITTLPALLLLSLAFAGFISCLFQLFLLKAIQREVPAIAAEIGSAVDDVISKVNNASTLWATDANGILSKTSNDINTDLLQWVNISSTAVNETLAKFVDETIAVLNQTFYGTDFNDAVQDVFNCLIGLKIQGIENGITWVQSHAQVNFPQLPNNSMTLGDMFGKSTELGSFLSDPQNVTQGDLTSAVNEVGSKVLATIKQEALLSLGIFICWLIVVFIGFAWMLYKLMGSDVVRPPTGPDPDANFYHYTGNSVKVPPSTGNSGEMEHYAPTALKSRFSGSPTDPAPAYMTTFPDLSSAAPYTLNPHPFPTSEGPRSSIASDDVYSNEKQQTQQSRMPFRKLVPTSINEQSNNPFQSRVSEDDSRDPFNEKNGFI